MNTYIGDPMDAVKAQQAQAGASALGNINSASIKPELGLIERTIVVVTGLQSLHARLGSFRDKIEGNGTACNNDCPTPSGLPGQLSEAESVLRACHSLLDDIAGKF